MAKGRLNPIGLIRGRGRIYWRIFKAFRTFFPMLNDWRKGRYRPLPKKAVGLMALAIVYVISPFDLIPDFIPFWGLIDDVIISGWLLAKIDEQLDDYRRWRESTGEPVT